VTLHLLRALPQIENSLPQQKKFTNFNEFSEIKKNLKNLLNARVGVAFQWNSLLICINSNKPTTTTEEFDAFHSFMLIKI